MDRRPRENLLWWVVQQGQVEITTTAGSSAQACKQDETDGIVVLSPAIVGSWYVLRVWEEGVCVLAAGWTPRPARRMEESRGGNRGNAGLPHEEPGLSEFDCWWSKLQTEALKDLSEKQKCLSPYTSAEDDSVNRNNPETSRNMAITDIRKGPKAPCRIRKSTKTPQTRNGGDEKRLSVSKWWNERILPVFAWRVRPSRRCR